MTPSPMRAEYQRVASEIAGVQHREPGDEQRDPDDVAGRAVEARDAVDDVAGQQRGDHADQRGPDHERPGRRSARAGRGGRCRGSAAPCPSAAPAPSPTDPAGTTASRPWRSWDGPRPHRLLPVDRPTPMGPGCSGRQCVSALRQVPAAAAPGRPARRRPAPRSRCGRRSAPAPPSPGWPPPAGAVSAATQVGHGGVEVGRRDDDVRQPDRLGLGRLHRAPGQADLHGPRVADQLHERARAGQVGHQAERRLGQPQLRVVGEDPQVAGQGELRSPRRWRAPAPRRSRRCPASAASGSRPGSRGCAPAPPRRRAGPGRPGRRPSRARR